MKRIAMGGAAVALAVGGAVGGAALAGSDSADARFVDGMGQRIYAITVENTTAAQPLSPPVIVTHNRRGQVWAPGQIATHALAAVAEDANAEVAVSAYQQLRGVRSAEVGVEPGASGPAPIPPGESQTYTITSRPGSLLSIFTMLVNTNDAFTGLHDKRIRNRALSFDADAYDAGSERNNQLASHIPGPVGDNPFVRDPEGELIRRHPGLQPGVGDIPVEELAWEDPVAKISMLPAGRG